MLSWRRLQVRTYSVETQLKNILKPPQGLKNTIQVILFSLLGIVKYKSGNTEKKCETEEKRQRPTGNHPEKMKKDPQGHCEMKNCEKFRITQLDKPNWHFA